MENIAENQPRPATLSTALTDVWNNSEANLAAKPGSGNPPEMQVKSYPHNIKITCLFCCNLMFQRAQPEVEKDEVQANRKRQLENLLEHLNLNKNEIPELCSKEMFPVCKGCQGNVDKLWQLQQELEKIELQIMSTLEEIRLTVANGEKLEPKIKTPKHPLVLEAEARKFTKLREMILEAYREALRMTVGRKAEDNSTGTNVGDAAQTQEPILSTSAEPEAISGGSYTKPALIPQTLRQSPQADDDINRAGPSSATRPPPMEVSAQEVLKNIKTEPAVPALQAEEDNFEWESDDVDILTLAERKKKKKKRQFFEGVEVFRCENPAKKEFLLCSVCNFTVAITQKFVKGNTPYAKMKAHINYIHTNEDKNVDKKECKNPAPIFECDFCAETFTSRESFQEHNATHPNHHIPAKECDICGRPIKANLRRHMFTHKNEEEQRAALDAREKGALKKPHSSRKQSTARLWKKKKSGRGYPKQLGHYECPSCPRSFPRKNGLVLHIKSHKRKTDKEMKIMAVPSTSSSCADVEVLKVKKLKKKKNARNENPPVLFPITPQPEVKTADMGTQTSPKRKKASTQNNEGQNEPGTSVEMQQEESDELLPILKREVEEERMETGD